MSTPKKPTTKPAAKAAPAERRTPEKPARYVVLEAFKDLDGRIWYPEQAYIELNSARTKALLGKENAVGRPFLKEA